jgi:hypothetical protein
VCENQLVAASDGEAPDEGFDSHTRVVGDFEEPTRHVGRSGNNDGELNAVNIGGELQLGTFQPSTGDTSLLGISRSFHSSRFVLSTG